jgi:hypothetical protein
VSDETWHGAESPPPGADYDPPEGDEGITAEAPPAVTRPSGPGYDHAREDCPYPAGCSGCVQEFRPPETVQERAARGEPDAVRRMQALAELEGRIPFDELPGGSSDYRSKADVWGEVSGPRRDPIEDIGAPERPPAKRLAAFRCGACDYLFNADEDTTVCVRCEVDGQLVEIKFVGPDPDGSGSLSVADFVTQGAVRQPDGVVVTANAAAAELREAGVLAVLGPHRQRLDSIWSEIASSIVTVLGAARNAVECWQRAGDVQATMETHQAMVELAVVLGMRPGPDGQVPRPHGPLAELLEETAEVMRAEAQHLDPVSSPRATGVARRLRDHAAVIISTLGETP